MIRAKQLLIRAFALVRPTPIIEGKSAEEEIIRSRYFGLALVVFVGTATMTVFHYWRTFYLTSGYPGNTFLFMPLDMFGDYYNMIYMTRDLDPYFSGSRSGYPPFANLAMWGFSQIPFDYNDARGAGVLRPFPLSLKLYLGLPILSLFSTLFIKICVRRKLERALIVLLLFMFSYPVLFAVDRGNLDLYVAVFVTLFAFSFCSTNQTAKQLGVFALSCGIALKIYPLIFAILFVKQRRYHDLILCGTYTLMLSFGSLLLLEGGAYHNITGFREVMSLSAATLKTDWLWAHRGSTSFFSTWRLFAAFHVGNEAIWFSERWYSFSAAICSFLVLAFVTFRRLELWQALGILVCFVTGLPTISNDYRLTLFIPVMVLMIEAKLYRPIVVQILFACLALLMIPKNVYYLHDDIGVSSMISGMVLCILLLVFCYYTPPLRNASEA